MPERFEEVGPATTATGAGGEGGVAGGGGAAVGGASTGGAGGAGTGGAPSCDDGPGEPNDTIDEAFDLGSIEDCDDQSKVVLAVLADQNDVDWYRYAGSDAFGCVVDPTRGLSATGTLRLCAFFECANGGPAVDCPDGTTQATAGALPGCCGDAAFAAGLDCSGSDDAANVYIRVDHAGDTCEPYMITYHY